MLKRRVFVKKAAAVAAALGITSSALSQEKKIRGQFVHIVLFWLKEETDPDLFMRETEILMNGIPLVQSFHIGRPAMTPREVVDNSYTLALVMTFDKKEDHDQYQKDPIHQEYVDKNKDKWEKVLIYDSHDSLG